MTAVKKRWPDGTPRSTNTFTAALDGRTSVFGAKLRGRTNQARSE
jgi:hypothetical protein